MTNLGKSLIGLLIIYAFTPLLAFIFFFIGSIFKAFTFPVQLFRQFIYPVGPIVDIVWIAGSFLAVSLSILSIVNKKI